MKRREFLAAGSGAGFLTSMAAKPHYPSRKEEEEHEKPVKIAAFQGKCSNDFDQNLKKVLEVITSCSQEGADFLCFPEGFLSDYSSRLAVRLDDPKIQELVRLTGQYDTVTIVGLSERENGNVFNTAIVIHRGRVLGKYRKTMLTESDAKQFASDYSLPVFEAKGIRFGVIICHDSSFVEPAMTMRKKGARLLFSPHYNSISSNRMDEHRRKVRNNHIGLAALLQMVVVRSNVVGWKEDDLGYGDTTIFSPLGDVVASAPLFQETLITAEFERAIFKKESWASQKELPEEVLQQLKAEL